MNNNIKWITKNGVHIPITNNYMNNKIRNNTDDPQEDNIKEVSHITKKNNYDSIIDNGFSLDKANTGAGSVFGKGVYFTDNELEKKFYMYRLGEKYDDITKTWDSREVKAKVDTSGFLEVEYDGSVKSTKNMYNELSKVLTKQEKASYNKELARIKLNNKLAEATNNSNIWTGNPEKTALMPIIERNYPGLIVKQKNMNGMIDPLTGGNQIVVYDLTRIKNVK